MGIRKYEVPVGMLRWDCDPSLFQFESTSDLLSLREFIGQDRATKAVEFGLNMTNVGYNIYVAGLSGTGKTSMVKTFIEKLIKEKESSGEASKPDDWCYVYNFKEPDCPKIMWLPNGKGRQMRDSVEKLLDEVKEELGRAFSSGEYKNQRQKIIEDSRDEQQKIFHEVDEEARLQEFTLEMSPVGPVLIPVSNGHPMEEKEYLALEETEKKALEAKQSELRKKVTAGVERVIDLQRKTVERLAKVDKDIGNYTITRLFSPILADYKRCPEIIQYLNDLSSYTLDKLELFKETEEPVHPLFGVPVSQVAGGRNPFLPYKINVFVDNSDAKSPPVIIEHNPNFGNMFGKTERRFLLGGYISDHTMLKPGALNLANGGYLLLNAQDVLMYPGVWMALKRAIKNKEVRIEDPFEQYGLFNSQGMKPEPMPVNVKIIMIGDALLYQLLSMYDEDFWEIFKVKADFNFEVAKTRQNMLDYAAFVAGCCEESRTRHFDPGGVAKIIEYSARLVADQEKLSSRFAQIKEWIEEANYWADMENSKLINSWHVKKAIDEKVYRHNLIDERIREMINQGTIMIDIEGKKVGQVNGLSVYYLGDISFGRPARITAQTFLGRSGIINIERESQLSGPIHSKGVMILGGYLGWKYAQEIPLSLSASLCFEQSYEGVEGDSASSAELYAILSSLADVPLKQNIAVTGSVNQRGEIQPIGGINEKIEGFFRVCQAVKLTGDQGVLMPHQNLKNLMLSEEVVEAVRAGKFHIYAAKTIDEGIEIITGVKAGKLLKGGKYTAGTINFRVSEKLKSMADKLRIYNAADGKNEKPKKR